MGFRNVGLGSRGIRPKQIPLKKENQDEEGVIEGSLTL